MRNNTKMLSFVLLVTIVLTTAQTISASTEDTWKVRFSCYAAGRSFVLWGILPDEPPYIPEWYIENSTGFITSRGSAYVKYEPTWWPPPHYAYEFPYLAELGSLRCIGFLAARWTHGSDKYTVAIAFYSNEKTGGVFDPENDYFFICNLTRPESESEWGWLAYKGIFINHTDNDRQLISGDAWLQVTGESEFEVIWFTFGLEWEDSIPVSVFWTNLPPYEARVFRHSVKLLDL